MIDVKDLASRITVADVAALAVLFAYGGELPEGELMYHVSKLGYNPKLVFLWELKLVEFNAGYWRLTRRGVELLEAVDDFMKLFDRAKIRERTKAKK